MPSPRPRRIQRPQFEPYAVGDIGLNRAGGYITDEFLPELSGSRGMRVYREMSENDPTCGAILFGIEMLVRNAKWTLQSASDDPQAEEQKQFADEVLFQDMAHPFESALSEICSMFSFGFAPMEIMWKRRRGDTTDPATRSKYEDGKVGIRALSLRAQPTIIKWEFADEDDGEVLGMYQQPPIGAERYIESPKLLLFRTTTVRGNPEGRSILRSSYRPWFFKKRIEEIEGVGLERDLAGLPVAEIPLQYMKTDAPPEDQAIYNAWKSLVQNVRRDRSEGIVIPSNRDDKGNPLFALKLLSTGGSRAFDTTKIVDRYDRRIATSVLADFIFLGQQSVGSFALSSDKTALFATAIGGFMRAIAAVFNNELLPRLWYLNGMDYEHMPKLVPGDLEKPDLQLLGGFLDSLVGAGARLFPDRTLENHLREVAGLPMAPEDGEDDFLEDPRYALDPAVQALLAQQGEKQEPIATPAKADAPAQGKDDDEKKVVPMRARTRKVSFLKDGTGQIVGAQVDEEGQ